MLPGQDRNEPRVVGGQGWHRPIAGRPDLREASILELEEAPTLGQEHRSGQGERRLGHRRELHTLLDGLALERAEVKVDAGPKCQHQRQEEDRSDPAHAQGKFALTTGRICAQWGRMTLCPLI